jgi:hypothetical protein
MEAKTYMMLKDLSKYSKKYDFGKAGKIWSAKLKINKKMKFGEIRVFGCLPNGKCEDEIEGVEINV